MIDIIIPCFDAHNTLEKTLQSILYQSIKNKIKVLIIDDCSKKNYDNIINKYKKFFDISCISLKENLGAGNARKEGLKNSNSEYIMFIDSDDLLFNSYSIEKLYTKIEEGYDLVTSIEYDEKNNIYFNSDGNLHGKIYKRKYLENKNIQFNDSRIHEDNYFNNYVILSGANYCSINECTYYYVYNTNSTTNKEKNFNELEIYLKNIHELLSKKNEFMEDRINKYVSDKKKYINSIYKNLNENEKKIFWEWYNKYNLDILK